MQVSLSLLAGATEILLGHSRLSQLPPTPPRVSSLPHKNTGPNWLSTCSFQVYARAGKRLLRSFWNCLCIFVTTEIMCADKTDTFTSTQSFLWAVLFLKPLPLPSPALLYKLLGCFRATFLHLPMLKCQQVFWWLKQSGVRAPNPRTCHSPGQMAMWWWQTAFLKQAYWVAKQSSI